MLVVFLIHVQGQFQNLAFWDYVLLVWVVVVDVLDEGTCVGFVYLVPLLVGRRVIFFINIVTGDETSSAWLPTTVV